MAGRIKSDPLNDQNRTSPITVEQENPGINAVELCSGGGGMSSGIQAAGIRLRAAAEIDRDMAAIHEVNHPTTTLLSGKAGDIQTLTGTQLLTAAGLKKGQLDLLAGGIPCQGFSLNGKRNRDDPRNNLWEHVPRLAQETGARMVVVENVPGMESLANGEFLRGLLAGLETLGFETSILRLDAADYGVPQHRRRIFIVGAAEKGSAPPPLEKQIGTMQAIQDLPEGHPKEKTTRVGLPYHGPPNKYSRPLRTKSQYVRDCGYVQHADFIVDRFKGIPPGARDEPTRHRRLFADRPAYTLLAGAKTITACRPIHPKKNRVLAVREGARLFGYHDSYKFGPTVQKSWYALGNSVPPLLASHVFKHLKNLLSP